MDYAALAARIRQWGAELGFQAVGIADTDLAAAENRLGEWLGKGWHGEMDYMARHGALRARPAEVKGLWGSERNAILEATTFEKDTLRELMK